MRNIARQAVFFSISYILLFFPAALFRFLTLWMEAARIMPSRLEYSGDLIAALAWAVPVTLYVSVLLALTYSARKNMPVFRSIFVVIALAAAFTLGASMAVRMAERMNFAVEIAPAVRLRPGLILSRSDTAMVLLTERGPDGPRVVSFPEQDLLYQGEGRRTGGALLTPALPFGGEAPWFIQSIIVDFNLCVRQFDVRMREGLPPFAVYAGALILLLGSLRFLLGVSAWPLANLFLGTVVFRGILAFETFLNASETRFMISSFFDGRLPEALITPLVFAGLGVLVLLYTLLAKLARGKAAADD